MYVRHCSASSGLEPWWSYDPVRKMVLVTMPRGPIAVDVCSLSAPRYGAYPIVRVNASTWKILPVRYTSRDETGELVGASCPVGGAFGSDFVHLLDASPAVAEELARLGR